MSTPTVDPVVQARPSLPDLQKLAQGLANLPEVMAQMGYTSLRGGQEPVITSIMAQRDTLCVLPTGTGKTATFVIPALCLNMKTVVFSPLQALMRDQVKGLWRMGIKAACMSGMQTDVENADACRQWMAGRLQFIYVVPERLKNPMFIEAMRAVKPDFVVVDEVHTLSQWSDNFRPEYCRIGDFVAEKNPGVVAAFTATFPPEVEADVRRVLHMEHAERLMHYPRRTNLDLQSRDFTSMYDILETLQGVEGSAIVYCSTIKHVEEVAAYLSASSKTRTTMYYGDGMTPEQKRTNQDEFMSGRAPWVVATNAFGMGIDKPDVRCVVHRDLPGSLEAMAQEAGRGGRDGEYCLCRAFVDKKSIETQKYFLACGHPSKGDIQKVFNTLRRIVDSDNTCRVTLDVLGRQSSLNDGRTVQSIVHILTGARVIERFHVGEKIAQIEIRGSSEDPRFKKYAAAIKRGGALNGTTQRYEVDMNWLATDVGVGYGTVQTWLRNWDREGLISFIAPFAGKATKIIGDMSLVDFDRLNKKAEDAYKKLDLVLEYLDTPDKDKHEFLETYFKVVEQSK